MAEKWVENVNDLIQWAFNEDSQHLPSQSINPTNTNNTTVDEHAIVLDWY
jgi:hypothetical protein